MLAVCMCQDCGRNMAMIHAVSYRRDVVFSQAVSTSGIDTFDVNPLDVVGR